MDSLVFTNGCFDVFHYGHLHLLKEARKYGSRLIVGINSDESIKRIKGPSRPIFPFKYRSEIVTSLLYVDGVIKFDEDTPIEVIKRIKPNILVKGGDWKDSEIIGSDFVKSIGGKVITIPYIDGFSSTNIIEKLYEI